ncbi:MAG: hypothetical protein KGL39_21640 [Patescibacteria group bacterium]|nr:hypothetical protein [Patescibacteria group bacterium]
MSKFPARAKGEITRLKNIINKKNYLIQRLQTDLTVDQNRLIRVMSFVNEIPNQAKEQIARSK